MTRLSEFSADICGFIMPHFRRRMLTLSINLMADIRAEFSLLIRSEGMRLIMTDYSMLQLAVRDIIRQNLLRQVTLRE